MVNSISSTQFGLGANRIFYTREGYRDRKATPYVHTSFEAAEFPDWSRKDVAAVRKAASSLQGGTIGVRRLPTSVDFTFHNPRAVLLKKESRPTSENLAADFLAFIKGCEEVEDPN